MITDICSRTRDYTYRDRQNSGQTIDARLHQGRKRINRTQTVDTRLRQGKKRIDRTQIGAKANLKTKKPKKRAGKEKFILFTLGSAPLQFETVH